MVPFASIVAVSPRNETTLPRMRTVWLVKESRYLALIRGVASEAIFATFALQSRQDTVGGGYRRRQMPGVKASRTPLSHEVTWSSLDYSALSQITTSALLCLEYASL